MNRTATKLTEEARDGKPIYCVQWPKLPKGRNRKYFKEKIEAETFLKQKLVEQKNYGDEGMASACANARNIWNVPRSLHRLTLPFAMR